MQAKYSRMKSVREMGYERLTMRMKPEYDSIEEHRVLLDEMRMTGVEWEYRYYVNYKTENRKKVE